MKGKLALVVTVAGALLIGSLFSVAPVWAAKKDDKPGKLTNLQRIRRIEEVLESIRPQLRRDHGDIELVDVDGKTVYVNMTGACSGCQLEAVTLQGVQQKLMEALGEFVKIVPTRAGSLARAASQA